VFGSYWHTVGPNRVEARAQRTYAMKMLTITKKELEEVKQIQIERHWKWPAALSTNRVGDIWSYETQGHTPPELREQVRGISKLIDAIASEYLNVRSSGGRFFITDTGAFYSPHGNEELPFLTFVFLDSK